MTAPAPDPASTSGRGPFWRVLQLIAGVALFLYALRLLAPMPLDRLPFVLLAALLAAGSMSLSDSAVGLLATVYENLQKGRKA
jgi:hypothetical protein